MNWLISYPRSGSTYFRYCIEFVTKFPTIGYFYDYKNIDYPIGSLIDLGVSLQKFPILVKRHEFSDIKNNHDIIVLIIRNPYEAIIRHHLSCDKKNLDDQIDYYFNILNQFDLCENKKIFIYYEDIVRDLNTQILKILNFLNENINQDNLKSLLDNQDFHRKQAISLYEKYQAPSLTKGNSLIYHLKKYDREYNFIKNKISNYSLNDKYLWSYYD